jgi:hypothetical protein
VNFNQMKSEFQYDVFIYVFKLNFYEIHLFICKSSTRVNKDSWFSSMFVLNFECFVINWTSGRRLAVKVHFLRKLDEFFCQNWPKYVGIK